MKVTLIQFLIRIMLQNFEYQHEKHTMALLIKFHLMTPDEWKK